MEPSERLRSRNRDLEIDCQRQKALLRSVVEISLELFPFGVPRCDDTAPEVGELA